MINDGAHAALSDGQRNTRLIVNEREIGALCGIHPKVNVPYIDDQTGTSNNGVTDWYQ